MRTVFKVTVGVLLAFFLCAGLVSGVAAKEFKEAVSQDVEAYVAKNKGKIVVVNVFATWCAPCVTEVPDFVKAHTTYPEEKLAMLGVSIDEDKQELANFLKEQNIAYPVYRVGEEFAVKYRIESIPQTYIHDQSGKLYKRFEGMITFEELQEAIEHLLASSPESGDM